MATDFGDRLNRMMTEGSSDFLGSRARIQKTTIAVARALPINMTVMTS